MEREKEFVLQALNPLNRGGERPDGMACENLNWARVLEIADAQLAAPLLYPRLSGNKKIPSALVARLRRAYSRQVVMNLLMFEELKSLQRELGKEKADVILIKGFAAAANYDIPFARHATDIDLLFRREDLDGVEHALYRLGWSADILYPGLKKDYLDGWYHLPEFRKGLVLLEMHTGLSPNIRTIDYSCVWKNSKKTRISGLELRVLSPEHQFLYACVHACLNEGFYRGLKNLMDIALLARNKGIDWNLASEDAGRWGIGFLAYSCLRLCRVVWGPGIPDYALNAFRQVSSPGQLKLAEEPCAENLFLPLEECMRLKNRFRLAHARGLRQKSALLAEMLFPSRVRLSLKYGIPLRDRKMLYACALANPFITIGQAAKAYFFLKT